MHFFTHPLFFRFINVLQPETMIMYKKLRYFQIWNGVIDTEVYTVFVFFSGLCPKIIEVHSWFILNAYFQNSTTADAISSLFPQLGARLSEPDQFSSVSAESKSYPFKVVGTKSVVVTYLFFFSQQNSVEKKSKYDLHAKD